jgi:hypothetical protein
MEAVSTSETSVNFYQTTRRNIPEDSHFILVAVRTWNLARKNSKAPILKLWYIYLPIFIKPPNGHIWCLWACELVVSFLSEFELASLETKITFSLLMTAGNRLGFWPPQITCVTIATALSLCSFSFVPSVKANTCGFLVHTDVWSLVMETRVMQRETTAHVHTSF